MGLNIAVKSFGIGAVGLAWKGWVCGSVGVFRKGGVVMLFVRVNQVLVRLWALPFAFV